MSKTIVVLGLLALLAGALSAQLDVRMENFPAWSSFMGCAKASSDYLGCELSADWLWGAMGFGFILNMYPNVCPSSPTAFNSSFLLRNAESLGLNFSEFSASAADPDFKSRQREALTFVEQSLAAGNPVFGWEMDIAEFYLIVDADKDGYRYLGFDGTQQTCPIDHPGTSDIGWLDFLAVSRIRSLDTFGQIKATLNFLRDYNSDPQKYAVPGYTMGITAYDVWIKGISAADANHLGIPYNAQVWSEARTRALGFLMATRDFLGKDYKTELLDKAIDNYATVAKALSELCAIYNFPPRDEDITLENADTAAKLLSQARDAERAGLDCLLEFSAQL